MENITDFVEISTLKGNIKCCSPCKENAAKKVQQINGVNSINHNEANGTMTVSEEVDPAVLVKKFGSWGKKAEIVSLQEKSSSTPRSKQPTSNSPSKAKSKNNSRSKCDEDNQVDRISCDLNGTSESDGSNANNQRIINWKNPNMKTMKKKTEKKGKKKLVDLLDKKVVGENKWSMPFSTWPSCPPVHGGGTRPTYHPLNRSMILPPQPMALPLCHGGPYQSRPLRVANPIFRYTSYLDNYSLY